MAVAEGCLKPDTQGQHCSENPASPAADKAHRMHSQPNGIDFPTRKMPTAQGNLRSLLELLQRLFYRRDLPFPAVTGTTNQQSVVGDAFRNVYRNSKHHVAGVPSLPAKGETALEKPDNEGEPQ